MTDALIHAIPNPVHAVKGEEFDVCYWIETPDNVQAADLHLKWNPNRLRFLTATAGADLPINIQCRYNNKTGTLSYGGMRYVTPATGHIDYVRFTFLARAGDWTEVPITCTKTIVAAPGGIRLPWVYEPVAVWVYEPVTATAE